MDNYGLCAVPDAFECGDKGGDIISVSDENIVKSHSLEEVAFSLAVCFTEKLQIFIHTAVVFGDGHIIVIDDYDKVGRLLACKVKSFKCLAAAQRTVAYNCDYIFAAALEIPRLSKSAGKAQRSRCVSDSKEIMLAFRRLRISRNIIEMLFVKESVLSACQHLVAVALMRYIIYDLINRGIENIVECDRSFYHAQVRSAVAAVNAELVDKRFSHVLRKHCKLAVIKLFHISGGVYFFKYHFFISFPQENVPVFYAYIIKYKADFMSSDIEKIYIIRKCYSLFMLKKLRIAFVTPKLSLVSALYRAMPNISG